MAIHLAQVTFEHESGLPEDVTVNTWWFDSTVDPAQDFANLRALLDDFYFVPAPAATAIAPYFSTAIHTSASTMTRTLKVYRREDLPPRAPVFEDTATKPVSTNSTTRLPAEVAMVTTFHAPVVSGIPQARRRNRVYLGPLNAGSAGSVSNAERPAPTFVTDIAASSSALIAAQDASISWNLVAYSPTYNTFATVTAGWVDNAFDTQRRRGLAPTARTLFS